MTYKQRKRNLYDSTSLDPYPLSRSRIENYLDCPRCFYLDRKLGFDRLGMPGFALNNAVDELFKKEFDILREKGESHELVNENGLNLIPFKHADLPIWRDDVNKFVGASFLHRPTNFEIRSIVDDIWQDKFGTLYIIDYKATSTKSEISLEDKYRKGYRNQLEIYRWIFRKKGFNISNKSYILYANATKDLPKFNKKLEFDLLLLEYIGNDSWVESTIYKIYNILNNNKIPNENPECDYCEYVRNLKLI